MADTEPVRIERNEMRKYPSEVTDLVTYLVNEQGVRYKWVDGDHIVLYPPDGVSRAFKISPKRPGPQQCTFIERQFMARQGIPGPDGVVPGAQSDPVDDAEGSDEGWSTDSVKGTQIASLVPGAREALKALADTLGVSLEGSVSEDEYLALVSEKDYCVAQVEELSSQNVTLADQVNTALGTIVDLTKQRDDLLERVHRLEDAITNYCSRLTGLIKD